jgi:hypothetical protein
VVNLDDLVVVGGFSTNDPSVVINVISASASDFDGVTAGCSCLVLS